MKEKFLDFVELASNVLLRSMCKIITENLIIKEYQSYIPITYLYITKVCFISDLKRVATCFCISKFLKLTFSLLFVDCFGRSLRFATLEFYEEAISDFFGGRFLILSYFRELSFCIIVFSIFTIT